MSKKHGSRLQVFTFREASLIIERDGLQRELNRSRKQHARELKKVKREHDCAKAAHKQRVALTHRLQRYIDYLEHKLDLVDTRHPDALPLIDDILRKERSLTKEIAARLPKRSCKPIEQSCGKPCGKKAASSTPAGSPFGV